MMRGFGFALWVATAAWAQIFPAEEPRPSFWVPEGCVSYDPQAHAFVRTDSNKGVKPLQVSLGLEYQPAAYADGLYWATNKLISTGAEEKPIKRILSSKDGKEWNLEGWIRLTEGTDVEAIQPMGGDRFLLVAFTRIRVGEKYSKFALATRKAEKELVLDRLIDMGLEKSWGIPREEGSLAGHFGVNPAYNELFVAGFPILRSGPFLAVVSLRAGFVWLMDTGKENPAMDLLRIHGGVKESMLSGDPHLEHCVLDAHATQDGHFLFAIRSERAVIFGAMRYPQPKDVTDIKNPLYGNDRSVAHLLSLRDEPDLEWRELDPFERTFHLLPSPVGVPERFTKPEEIRGFRFWFTPKGYVVCTLSTYVPGEPAAKPGNGKGSARKP